MKKLALSLLLLAPCAQARTVKFNKAVDISRLEKDLRAAGFSVSSTYCLGTKCEIYMPDSETKSPTAIIAAQPKPIDRELERADVLAELEILEEKLDGGSLTAAEIRRMFKIILKLMGASKS